MPRIVFIGAGSLDFFKKLLIDVLSHPSLRDSELVLVDIDEKRLKYAERIANRIVKESGGDATVEATQDRRKALKGADYITTTILVGGLEAILPDVQIPAKYGVDQFIGDTLGPGGVFRALRTVPVMLDIARDIEEYAPDALLINYTNPMSMLCWSLFDCTNVNTIGLCHSVQGTAEKIARYTGVPYEEVEYKVAGINHQAWYLKLEHNGEDLYPKLRESYSNKEFYTIDTSRYETLKYFDYFVTESSGHFSEYVPYFRKSQEHIKRFCPTGGWNGESMFVLKLYGSDRQNYEQELEAIASGEEPISFERSSEYATGIMNALETGEPFRFNGNVRNTGLITNLPEGCCVEVPCYVDKSGINPTYIGDLPEHLAALNRANIAVQRLTVEAIRERDRRKVSYAVSLDPLTAALLTLDEIHDMVEEMFNASRKWVPAEFYE